MFKVIKGLVLLTVSVIGVMSGYLLIEKNPTYHDVFGTNSSIKFSFLLGAVGYLLTSLLLREFELIWRKILDTLNAKKVFFGMLGIIFGGIIGNIIFLIPIFFLFSSDLFSQNYFLKQIEPFLKITIPIILNLFSAYIGFSIFIKYGDNIISSIGYKDENSVIVGNRYVIDTSSIIDARVVDLIKAGVLDGQIIVPVFVLSELQLIADSSDPIKRQRGRRGLDVLNQMKQDLKDKNFLVMEIDYPHISQVDAKLVALAKELKAKLITNDYNLNKVARLEGVKVININEIANAMKPVMVSGEKILVKVIKKGKDKKQGVAYLDDGTMIVIEDGGNFVGEEIEVTVKSILQTSAGRIIFTRYKMDT